MLSVVRNPSMMGKLLSTSENSAFEIYIWHEAVVLGN